MTAIKQVAVTTAAHAKNLAKYLNSDKALMRSSQNLINEKQWDKEMAQTRMCHGHDKPSRANSKNTIMYHQILAFNPDEIDLNGGKLTPQMCMNYTHEYIATRYPNQEVIWVLHKEHCKADNTFRYAVHIAINRTDLETGRRLNEGRAKEAKISRANSVRDLDRKFGLEQMIPNRRNSRVHSRQPTRAEKEMMARGQKPEKQIMREHIYKNVRALQANPDTNNVRTLAKNLEVAGIKMSISKNGDFIFERESIRINGTKLGRGFSRSGLVRALGYELGRELVKHSLDRST